MSEFYFICPFCGLKLLCDDVTENQSCGCPECGNEIVPVREKFEGKIRKAPVESESTTKQDSVVIPTQTGGTVVINNFNNNPLPQTQYVRNNLPKQRLVYILLGLFLGGIGAHNFYAEYKTEAIWQLIIWFIGILTFEVGGFVLCLGTECWSLVNIICRKVDGRGRIMV